MAEPGTGARRASRGCPHCRRNVQGAASASASAPGQGGESSKRSSPDGVVPVGVQPAAS